MSKQALCIVLLLSAILSVSCTKRRLQDHIYLPRTETCEDLKKYYYADGCDDEFKFTERSNGGLWCFRNQQHMAELGCHWCCVKKAMKSVKVHTSPCNTRFDGSDETSQYKIVKMADGFKFDNDKNPTGCSKVDGSGFTDKKKCLPHARSNLRCMLP